MKSRATIVAAALIAKVKLQSTIEVYGDALDENLKERLSEIMRGLEDATNEWY